MAIQLPAASKFLPGGEQRAYRVVRSAGAVDPRTGKKVYRSGVGVSFASEAEAEQTASDRAERAVAIAISGGTPDHGAYGYQADRRLEPLVDVVRSGGVDLARITVNGYGSLVMNADTAMFVDVDTDDERPDPKGLAIPAALRDLVSRRPDLGFRAYRTLAGWRYLCISATFDPRSNETRTILAELGADEKYVLLCGVQKSFRARLTPKPWRAGERPLDIGADGIERGKLQRYVDRTWRYATARFMETVGSATVAPVIAPVVDYHDAWTQALSSKHLA